MIKQTMLLLFLGACGGEEDKSLDTGSDPTISEGAAGPGAFAPDFETSPDFFTLMAAPVDGGTIHGTVQIWYSANLRDAIEQGGPFVAPVGSVAIKVQDNGAEAITAMVKQPPGFDPANGDWSYEQRAIDGTLNSEGPNAFCSDCHVGWSDTDYLAGTTLR